MQASNQQERTSSHDPHRPRYHFLPPANWLNDPNGLIQWNGEYHLFYQHNPYSPWHHRIHWGHAVSSDLIRWRHLPVALAPTPQGPDNDGCWSGCAVNNNGVPTIFYSGVYPQAVCMATSDDDLVTWTKHPGNPVIPRAPLQIDAGNPWEFRDPYVWQEGNVWYMLMGTRIVNRGGAILLYRSHNLTDWEYLHPLLVGDRNQLSPFWTATIWECPNLLRFGDKDVLIVSFQHHESGQLLYTGYFTGRFQNEQFAMESQYLLEYGAHFYAPQVMRDDHGRYLMWGWLWEGRSEEEQRKAGWAGVMTLPRVLTLDEEGLLRVNPVPELENIRGRHWRLENLRLAAGDANPLRDVQGDCLEIVLELQPEDATQFGLKVRCAPDGSEETWIFCDLANQFVTIEREKSSLAPTVGHDVLPSRQVVRNAPHSFKPGETVRLHVFLDRSVLEVFVNNGRISLSSRIYPTRADSLGIAPFVVNGRITIPKIDVWELNPPPP